MMNLFSVFDPSSIYGLNLMWLALLIPLIVSPMVFWPLISMTTKMPSIMFNMMLKELNQILMSFQQKGTSTMLLSLFFLILTYNFMGLFPYIFTTSAHLIITFSLATPFWMTFILYGWMNNTEHMLTHLLPMGTPPILSPFMVCVETISNLIRPITLSVRLAANMIAGHLIMTLISIPFSPIKILSIHSMFSLFPLMALELAVAIIQAFVFTMLLTLYSTEIH